MEKKNSQKSEKNNTDSPQITDVPSDKLRDFAGNYYNEKKTHENGDKKHSYFTNSFNQKSKEDQIKITIFVDEIKAKETTPSEPHTHTQTQSVKSSLPTKEIEKKTSFVLNDIVQDFINKFNGLDDFQKKVFPLQDLLFLQEGNYTKKEYDLINASLSDYERTQIDLQNNGFESVKTKVGNLYPLCNYNVVTKLKRVKEFTDLDTTDQINTAKKVQDLINKNSLILVPDYENIESLFYIENLFYEVKGKNYFNGAKLEAFIKEHYQDRVLIDDKTDAIYLFNREKNLYVKTAINTIKTALYGLLIEQGISMRKARFIEHIEAGFGGAGAYVQTLNIGLKNRYYHFKNGIYNIDETKLYSFDETTLPMHKVHTFVSGFDFDLPTEYTEPKKWLNHLKTSLQGTDKEDTEQKIRALMTFIGSLFFVDCTDEKALLMIGSQGANGKSTIMNVLQKLIPKQLQSSIPLADITQGLNKNASFKIHEFNGKIVNFIDDLDTSTRYEPSNIKTAISKGYLTAEQKFKASYQLKIEAKFIINANRLPKFKESGNAIGRRFIILRFDKTFEPNPNYDTDLYKEIPNIAKWIFEKCIPMYKKHGLITPGGQDADIQELREQGSDIYTFALNHLFYVKGAKLGSSTLFDAYGSFCESENTRKLSKKMLLSELQSFIEEKKGKIIHKTTTVNRKTERVYIQDLRCFASEQEHKEYLNNKSDDLRF